MSVECKSEHRRRQQRQTRQKIHAQEHGLLDEVREFAGESSGEWTKSCTSRKPEEQVVATQVKSTDVSIHVAIVDV
jgi:hypothetical protein